MRSFLFIIVCVLVVSACKPCKELQGCKSDTIIRKEIHTQVDTFLLTDTSTINLFYECNEQNQIIQKKYDSIKWIKPIYAVKWKTEYRLIDKIVKQKEIQIQEKVIKKIPWGIWVVIFSLLFCLIISFILMVKLFGRVEPPAPPRPPKQ